MDLRTKLVFALVAASLLGMAALGAFAYTTADELLTERTLRQLNSLAEAKEQDLQNVVEGWKDRVTLITSRTQLRISLRALGEDGSPEERERISRILADARGASATVRAVTVYDTAGRVVARAGPSLPEDVPPVRGPRPPPDSAAFVGLFFPPPDSAGESVVGAAGGPGQAADEGDDGAPAAEPTVEFLAPLALDGDTVGTLRARLGTRDLRQVAGNYTGMGETGETLIALRDTAGRIRILHPVRFPESAPGAGPGGGPMIDADPAPRERTSEPAGGAGEGPDGGDEPVARALAGQEGAFAEGLTDYRGEPVWAATRFLPELGWGLVVKADAAEERVPILEFRQRLTWVGLSLSAFAILLGILLGLQLAGPIHELARVADHLRSGDLEARAEVRTHDELGLLARTFNEMAEEMERRMELLQEYKRFFLVSPDMLCIAGPDGYFKRVNPAFERTLGWSADELQSRPFVEFVHPDDVEKTLRETEKLSQGVPTVSFENRYRRPDGSYDRLRWTCHPDPETGLLYAVARKVSEDEG